MNMRFLTVTLLAITACSLGACTVQSSGSTSATGTGGGGGEGGAGGVGGSGGSTACDPAYTCADAITPTSGNPAKLCDGPAKMLFTALSTCTCSGACAMACADSSCKNQDASTPCKLCLTNMTTGCGKEFNACINGG